MKNQQITSYHNLPPGAFFRQNGQTEIYIKPSPFLHRLIYQKEKEPCTGIGLHDGAIYNFGHDMHSELFVYELPLSQQKIEVAKLKNRISRALETMQRHKSK